MEKQIEFEGVRVVYTVNGEGPAVVLMHGWGCNTTTLASIEKTVLECGRTAVNIDFPGHGKSGEPTRVWGVDDYTRCLEAVIEHEGLQHPTLLGHSFGGRVGILYSSRHHDVERLILVDAAGIKPRRTLKYYYKVYTFKAMKRLLYLLHGKAAAEDILDRRRAKVGSSDYATATPMMRAILSRTVNEDLKHCLPDIKCPTLLIWGEADTATPLADAKYMEAHIPDAGLVSFPEVGHYSFLERPAQFAAVLRSFLSTKQ
jgi:pimeloyl-ACP methyl ester carboxylesterase